MVKHCQNWLDCQKIKNVKIVQLSKKLTKNTKNCKICKQKSLNSVKNPKNPNCKKLSIIVNNCQKKNHRDRGRVFQDISVLIKANIKGLVASQKCMPYITVHIQIVWEW